MKMIVAANKKNVIGRNGTLPWRHSADLAHFMAVTLGGHCLFGRATFDSLPRIEGREILIFSNKLKPRSRVENPNGCVGIVVSPKKLPHIDWLCGGGKVYDHFLKLGAVEEIWLSIIDNEEDGDTFLSDFRPRFHLVDSTTISGKKNSKEKSFVLEKWKKN